MTWLELLGCAVGALVVLGVGWLAMRAQRSANQERASKKTVAAMQREIDRDWIDDNSEVIHDLVQAARNRGDV